MNTNKESLINNLKRNPNGVGTFLDCEKDLLWKKEYNVNSWFVIGHAESENHTLNFLFHLMLLDFEGQQPVMESVVSITDETTGWYYGDDIFVPVSDIEISEESLNIKMPNGQMSGNLEKMLFKAEIPNGSVDIVAKPVGLPIYNSGTGYFPLLDMKVHQYSIPTMETSGSITIEGHTYEINCTSWFDRQWQNQVSGINGHWTWMDLNLDNGDKLSLWNVVDDATNIETAWATVLHEDGTQSVVTVEPLKNGESEYWTSEKSNQKYPTQWIVKIPEYDACLKVISSPKEQEIVSAMPTLNKYEGASKVSGTYRGKEVKGYCYVELVGYWR